MLRPLGLALLLAMTIPAWCASKPHVVFLGKPQPVRIALGPAEDQSVKINVRPLYVDTKLKDYTTGDAHDVTDRQFVVQRAYRLNDALPGDSPKQARWVWQRGDWLLVDRSTGHVGQVKLPEFESSFLRVSWYRDYAAYCGVTENGVHLSFVVAQIGVRKALFHKDMAVATQANQDSPAAQCAYPRWERRPPRVTFSPANGQPFTVNVAAGHAQESADSEAEQ